MNIRKEDRPKTDFVCHAGSYQYKRTQLGLTIAPATFQCALDLILTQFGWKTCLEYVEDVIIYSKTVEDHIRHVK